MCSELEFSKKKVSEWVVAKCFCVQFGLFWVKSSGRTRVIETAHVTISRTGPAALGSTGFILYGERMVTRTCPGEWSAVPTFRTKRLDRADKHTIRRWKQDGYRLSTFQYEAETSLWKGDEWRLPSPDELDELLGYPRGYTGVANATNLQREQMLGNTMHGAAVVRLLEDLKSSPFLPTASHHPAATKEKSPPEAPPPRESITKSSPLTQATFCRQCGAAFVKTSFRRFLVKPSR